MTFSEPTQTGAGATRFSDQLDRLRVSGSAPDGVSHLFWRFCTA